MRAQNDSVYEQSHAEIKAIVSSILDSIPHAVIGLRDRHIIFANHAVESVFGWKPEELIGKTTRVLYRNDDEYEEIGRSAYPVLESERTYS
jgi:PAS domain S-box-containing protein